MAGWFSAGVSEFCSADRESIVGALSQVASRRGLSPTKEQVAAWEFSIDFLKAALGKIDAGVDRSSWSVLLEYEIPRRGIRPDAVVLAGRTVVVVEFKVGADRFDSAALVQTLNYALDLRDFHAESADCRIVPVLVASESGRLRERRSIDGARLQVECISAAHDLAALLVEVADHRTPALNRTVWDSSAYQPVPDILSAAREVYAGNNVREVSLAYADNLGATVEEIRRIISEAARDSNHVAVFVTGVPGSGKTLAGLSAVHQISGEPGARTEPLGAYLSGNGPLVEVLSYALALDVKARDGCSKAEAERIVKTFIQPVHLYVQEYSDGVSIPPDRVIVFDEAQRAWDQDQMVRKQKIDASEASIILDAMGRVSPWSVLVALVGEGQEINKGEAGLGEWARALTERPEWSVRTAPDVANRFKHLENELAVDPSLHLGVSVRSPRARAIADWADAVVSGRFTDAAEIIEGFPDYPLFFTRSLGEMRRFLRDHASEDRRVGLLASSQARRLRAFGVEMDASFQGGVHWPRWFVDGPNDLRSSMALEIAASEFKCQGLEIDYVGLCWGHDLTWQADAGSWTGQKLRGGRWTRDSDITFARNRYRVLLTRARYGLVIWVPDPVGDELEVSKANLNSTVLALQAAGVRPLEH